MQLPLGVADPMFLAELALELKMPVGELGQRMSNHELTVFWPCFFEARAELQRLQEKLEGSVSPEQFDAEFERSKPTMGGGS